MTSGVHDDTIVPALEVLQRTMVLVRIHFRVEDESLCTTLQLHARETNQLRRQLPTLPTANPVSLIANNRLKER